MSNDAKVLRKQLRNIAQELLPDLLKTEMFMALQEENVKRLNQIAKEVQETLKQIQDRQKDAQSLIMRELMSNIKTAPAATTPTQE